LAWGKQAESGKKPSKGRTNLKNETGTRKSKTHRAEVEHREHKKKKKKKGLGSELRDRQKAIRAMKDGEDQSPTVLPASCHREIAGETRSIPLLVVRTKITERTGTWKVRSRASQTL